LAETLKETLKEIRNKLPEEPEENDENAITITYKFQSNSFTSRFSILNTILVYNI